MFVCSRIIYSNNSIFLKFYKKVNNFIKNNYPQIKQVDYYSDGCAGQYKNFKNFLNLSYHHEDFGLGASWNFFASCHGKSNCDGIGAAAKRKLRNKSLTVGPKDAILSSLSAFSFLNESMPSVEFFHIEMEAIEDDKLDLDWKKGTKKALLCLEPEVFISFYLQLLVLFLIKEQ